ncbi:MAG TPA: hypothetical protein VL595_29560 [Pseudonocardia sp.]|nr:hypothetical protein [Pseudonocardia sp.]
MDETQAPVRPVHTVIDCGTREIVHTPLSDAEVAAQQVRVKAAADAEAAQVAADAELRAQVAAHPDPLVQALAARLLGTGPAGSV